MEIEVIGRGNVAHHLTEAFSGKANIRLINPHTLEHLNINADLILISVSDNAITEVTERLAPLLDGHTAKTVVAHTSGTTPLSALSALSCSTGVMWPMQTFTKGIPLEYSEIPVFIESTTNRGCDILKKAASMYSNNVYVASSADRCKLHLASVMACNFTNHIWALTYRYLKQQKLNFETLIPLIRETLKKAGDVNPATVQTGPASRHDTTTLGVHEQMLSEYPDILEIYRTMTRSIIEFQQNELV